MKVISNAFMDFGLILLWLKMFVVKILLPCVHIDGEHICHGFIDFVHFCGIKCQYTTSHAPQKDSGVDVKKWVDLEIVMERCPTQHGVLCLCQSFIN